MNTYIHTYMYPLRSSIRCSVSLKRSFSSETFSLSCATFSYSALAAILSDSRSPAPKNGAGEAVGGVGDTGLRVRLFVGFDCALLLTGAT